MVPLWLLGSWSLWGLLLGGAGPRAVGSKVTPKVTERIPKYGSINGATRLTIKGEEQNNLEEQFILRRSRTAFHLLDLDGEQRIGANIFQAYNFLFNLEKLELGEIYHKFDISCGRASSFGPVSGYSRLCFGGPERLMIHPE